MSSLSLETGRQIGLLVNRNGRIEFIMVGDRHRIHLPDFGRLRAGKGRFRGLRMIHTHLSEGGIDRDDLVDLFRLRLDMVASISVGNSGDPENLFIAHLLPEPDSREPWVILGPYQTSRIPISFLEMIQSIEEEFARKTPPIPVDAVSGRGIVINVTTGPGRSAEESLDELEVLASTAGVKVVERVIQKREKVDPRYVLGRGKLEEIVLLGMQHDAEILIFDRDITPLQARTIGEMTDMKVVDRTQVILDIFARQAKSVDGKLQVELAQLKYRLPRLGQRDDALSRLTGGIGGRGPGETKLEISRRRARDRIARIEKKLNKLASRRRNRRKLRQRSGTPVIALVGYTNSGKSTLLNALTKSKADVEDRPFVTLDPLSRQMMLPSGRRAVLIDTVGFIKDLPKDLLAAFRATLEEAGESDLMLNVVDAHAASSEERVRCVEELLMDLDYHRVPQLTLWNKCDLLDAEQTARTISNSNGVMISALDPSTLEPLLESIERILEELGLFRN